MGDPAPARRLSRDAIERMVGIVRPDWQVRTAALATDGVSPVYRLGVDGPSGRRECVLKAARSDDGHLAAGDAGAEARLLAVLREHTTIPVPEVLGVVDDHDAVGTPFFLMEAMEGTEIRAPEVGTLPVETVRRVARRSGRHLGQLHAVEFEHVTTFGRGIHRDDSPPLRGGRPDGDPAGLVLSDGHDDFRAQLREWWADDVEDRPDAGRFGDLWPAIRAALSDRIADVPASLDPTVARLDHGWHNLLVDPADGEVAAVLDWGTLAAFPPAYDLALVELRLAGGAWLALPEVPDRREVIRAALLAGYREERPVPPALDAQRACYHLDILQSWMASLGSGVSGRAIPGDRVDDAAAGFRDLVAPLVE